MAELPENISKRREVYVLTSNTECDDRDYSILTTVEGVYNAIPNAISGAMRVILSSSFDMTLCYYDPSRRFRQCSSSGIMQWLDMWRWAPFAGRVWYIIQEFQPDGCGGGSCTCFDFDNVMKDRIVTERLTSAQVAAMLTKLRDDALAHAPADPALLAGMVPVQGPSQPSDSCGCVFPKSDVDEWIARYGAMRIGDT